MISGINISTPWPNEVIDLYAAPTSPPIITLTFANAFKRFGNPYFLNNTPTTLISIPSPSYNLSPNLKNSSFPYPQKLPFRWNVGKNSDTYLETEILNSNGVSGVTVFPSHIYPSITAYNTNTVDISSTLCKAKIYNESSVMAEWPDQIISYRLVREDSNKILEPIPTFTTSISSAHYSQFTNNNIFANVDHPTTAMDFTFPIGIVPTSFSIRAPITNPYLNVDDTVTLFLPADINHSYSNSLIYGRSDNLYIPLTTVAIGGTVDYAAGTGVITYSNGYFASAGDFNMAYRVSSSPATYAALDGSTNAPLSMPLLGTNYYTLSTKDPLYFYEFDIAVNSNTVKDYPTLYWMLSTQNYNSYTSAVNVSAWMMDNFHSAPISLSSCGTSALLKYDDLTFFDVGTLSCIVDGTYKAEGEWFEAYKPFYFKNDGVFGEYTIQYTLSTIHGSNQTTINTVALNGGAANFTLDLTANANDAFIEVQTESLFLDESSPVIWSVFPSANITLRTYSDYVETIVPGENGKAQVEEWDNYTDDQGSEIFDTSPTRTYDVTNGQLSKGTTTRKFARRMKCKFKASAAGNWTFYHYGNDVSVLHLDGIYAGTVNGTGNPTLQEASYRLLLDKDQEIDIDFWNTNTTQNWNGYVFVSGPGVSKKALPATHIRKLDTIARTGTESINIPLNTNVYHPSAQKIIVDNLGVAPTTITYYNSQFGVSASTIWYPIANSFINTKAVISGIYTDVNEIPTGYIDIKADKNGKIYDIPSDATVYWNVDYSADTATLEGSGKTDAIYFNDNFYPGDEARTLYYTTSSECATFDPTKTLVSVNTNTFGNFYNWTSDDLEISVSQKPCDAYITFSISGVDAQYDSKNKCDVAVLSTNVNYTFVLSANTDTLVADPSSINWYINDVFSTTGLNITASLSSVTDSLSCYKVSAQEVSAKSGNFPLLNYSDEFCFCFKDELVNFEWVIYPDMMWNGGVYEASNLTVTDGPTAYANCHTECFQISATSGFDVYKLQLDDDIYTFDTNTFEICLTELTAKEYTTSVSAFNDCYSINCPATVYNSASSISSNNQKRNIQFYDYPVPTNDSVLNDSVYNLNFDENLVSLTASYNHSTTPVKVLSGNLTLTLTDIWDGRVSSKDVTIVGNNNILVDSWSILDENSMFYVPENTARIYTLEMSGNLTQIIEGYDYCPKTIELSTKTFNITALDGPEIALYTDKHCLATNEVFGYKHDSVIIDNEFGLSTLLIDFGNGTLSTISAKEFNSDTYYHSYTGAGTYTWEITGTLRNGLTNVVTYRDFICVSVPQIELNRTVQRGFPSDLELPYSRSEIADFSNEWIIDTTYNDRIEKVFDCFEYIQNNSYIYDPVLPNKYVGWLGNDRTKNLKWNFNEYAEQTQRTFSDIRDFVYDDNFFFLIDGNTFKIYENGFYPRLRLIKTDIGDDDTWKNLVSVSKKSNIVTLLDKTLNSVYFYRWNGNVDFKLLYYFGGWGNYTNKYKFNSPNDLAYNGSDTIICDTGNKSIKIYDITYNWKKTVTFENAPHSVCVNSNYVYILFEKTIELYDLDYNFIKTVSNSNSIVERSKIRTNGEFIFVNFSDKLVKYTIELNKVGEFKDLINESVNAITFDDGTLFIANKDKIHKVCDSDRYLDIRDVSLDAQLHDISAIKIYPMELVSDIVYNNSLNKLYQNFDTLNSSFTGRFYEIVDSCSHEFSSFEIRTYENSAIEMLSSKIGINECVNYSTIGREFNLIFDNLELLETIIDSEIVYPELTSCLTWVESEIQEGQRCFGRKYSWYDLAKGMECTTHSEEWLTEYSYISAATAWDCGEYFSIPYTLEACDYMTSRFAEVTCVPASSLIYFKN